MVLPAPKENSTQIMTRSTRCEPRCVLRGEVSDTSGNGEFVFSRQHQIGFNEIVEYETRGQGIAAINTFVDAKKIDDNTDDQSPVDRLLECRYSVIAETGCNVEHLKVIASVNDVEFSTVRIRLTWRGESLARMVDPDNQVAGRDDGSFIRQDETLILECGPVQNNTWHIEVPSHSVSLAIQIEGGPASDAEGNLTVIADAVFFEKSRFLDVPLDGKHHLGTGRIQPKKVLEIIERVENTIEQTPAEDVDNSDSSDENNLIYTTPEISVEDDSEYISNASSSKIDVVVCQKIIVFHGEDIILGTEGMFINRTTGDASYISANLPDWLFLDQNNGDLMGTVPVHEDVEEDLEFSIYVVDGKGNSAKAVILISCLTSQNCSVKNVEDYEFREGDQVSIETNAMFIEFGLDTEGLHYTATGLPENLTIGPNDGVISGKIKFGTAVDVPYEIVVAGREKASVGSETSMRFLLKVVESDFETNGIGLSHLPIAMNELYRMNKDCERILVANLAADLTGFAKGFSTRDIQLSTDSLLGEIEHTVVPMVRAFAPERQVFLQVHSVDENEAEESNFKYEIQLLGKKSLPDWIDFTSNGFVRIGCDPDRRYVDLELIQSGDDGFQQIYDICVDTFEGSLLPAFHQSDNFIEKQLQEVSEA